MGRTDARKVGIGGIQIRLCQIVLGAVDCAELKSISCRVLRLLMMMVLWPQCGMAKRVIIGVQNLAGTIRYCWGAS